MCVGGGGKDNLCKPNRRGHWLIKHTTDPNKLDAGTPITIDCFRSADMFIYNRMR